jgi:SAM-dependent methyltransferase
MQAPAAGFFSVSLIDCTALHWLAERPSSATSSQIVSVIFLACITELNGGGALAGSGNSVAAMLRVIDGVQVVATDVSPDLLAIMKESLGEEGLPVERVSLMCLDVHETYFNDERFDFVCGSAILHHLLDPKRAVSNALRALKPGGVAVFFEPFEYGCTILKLIHSRLLRESEMRDASGALDADPITPEAAEFLRNVSYHLSIREGISGGVKPITAELDDKWLFTREFFETIRAEVGASKLIVYSNHAASIGTLFEDYVRQNFYLGKGWGREALPAWAWDTVREFDREVSDEMKLSFMIEGTIIFVK